LLDGAISRPRWKQAGDSQTETTVNQEARNPGEVNQESRNRGNGISEIEGKGARVAASERGQRVSFKTGDFAAFHGFLASDFFLRSCFS
jgi:hypothetical protein